MRLWRKVRRETGWMVIDVGNGELAAVLGEGGAAHPCLRQHTVFAAEDGVADLRRAARELNLGRYQCATLLAPDDYQIVMVDAPKVPRDELKAAIRWRVKDLLHLHIDDVTLDVLDIPLPKDMPNHNPTMYAVAGRNEAIQAIINRFEDANVPLAVIDIPETAQRNIAALYEDAERAVALLYFDDRGGLLTINYGGELCYSRRFEMPFEQLHASDEAAREEAHDRVLLELQRSLDHFERQFRSISVTKLLIAPQPVPTGLTTYLAGRSGLPVQSVDLHEVLDISDGPLDEPLQWRLFHLIGASLRHEVKAL